ncbi:hypothetical protein QYE76_057953 [Lolium multiflorum]|uniref:Uncharacterized protein n=1 Tax=Lolium multiflorum TaxID=4521 RepID=A0AAD8T5M5_LOLMU|nr:hypothetical protein QYE76_057953 [Lolium multiflorum]
MAAAARRSVSTSDSHRGSHGSACSFPPPRQDLRLRELPPLKGLLIHGDRVHQHSGISAAMSSAMAAARGAATTTPSVVAAAVALDPNGVAAAGPRGAAWPESGGGSIASMSGRTRGLRWP